MEVVAELTRKPVAAIIMGSDSDLAIMKDAGDFMDFMDVPYELTIVSAHRTPDRLVKYAKESRSRHIEVIIAGAGGAAHLPGMIASLTTLPVIGVPIRASSLDGIDSLMSIVQMPPGVPVATVAINGAKNAAILACQILGIKYSSVADRLWKYKSELEENVLEKAERLEKIGFKKYLLQQGDLKGQQAKNDRK